MTLNEPDYTVWQSKDATGKATVVEIVNMGDTHLANTIKFLRTKIETLENKGEKRGKLGEFDAGQLTWSKGWLDALGREQERRKVEDIAVPEAKRTGPFVRPDDIKLRGENSTKLKNTLNSLTRKRDALDQQHPLSAWDKGLLQWYREQIQLLRAEVDKRDRAARS